MNLELVWSRGCGWFSGLGGSVCQAVNLEWGSRLFPGAWPLGAGESLGAESIVVFVAPFHCALKPDFECVYVKIERNC